MPYANFAMRFRPFLMNQEMALRSSILASRRYSFSISIPKSSQNSK